MNSGVYKITNTVNGKIYVGSSIDLAEREYHHRYCLRKGTHHNSILQKSYNKHGDVFSFEVVELCAASLVIEREQFWIDSTGAYTHGYNIVPVAGSTVGRKISDETRAKMARVWGRGKVGTRKGVPVSDATKEKLRLANLGKKLSAETIAKRSATMRENTKKREKRVVPDEVRAKMSLAASTRTRKPHSEETRAKLSAAATHRYAKVTMQETTCL
jgi:group I intron endonuclease